MGGGGFWLLPWLFRGGSSLTAPATPGQTATKPTTGDTAPATLPARLLLTGAAARNPVSGAANPAQLLDVDVDELARMAALVPVRRLRWLKP